MIREKNYSNTTTTSVVDGVLTPVELLSSSLVLSKGIVLALDGLHSSPEKVVKHFTEKVGIPSTYPQLFPEAFIASIVLCGALVLADGIRRLARH